MLNSPHYTLFFYEAYVRHFALSDQFLLQVFSHVLKFLSINLLAVFLINKLILSLPKIQRILIKIIITILIINVLKMALNNFRGHITEKDCLRWPKTVTFFLSCALVYSRSMQVDTVPLTTLLIASLVLIAVSGQN